jgi:hypothetical protein
MSPREEVGGKIVFVINSNSYSKKDLPLKQLKPTFELTAYP